MLKRTLAAVLMLSALPVLSAVEDPPAAPDIQVGIVVEATDFYAHNFSNVPQVLFFSAGGFRTWRVLQPGGDFSSTYARQALDGVKLEIASYVAGAWKTTGGFDLSSLCDSGADALWVQDGAQPPSWREVGNSLTPMTPEPSWLPTWVPTEGANQSTVMLEPLHVPVITPVSRGEGDTPPVLDEKPLPPG